ncbi:MAG: ABC transporter ATP-binding protein [Chloroflexi bacterium]|nr:ABC transporter ATP-binding protein [Chloroflexota bacterium]
MTDQAAVVQDLFKNYGDIKAVQGVSLIVQRGEIFSLLGPNGAGKTTLLSMLACLLEPARGDAWVLGHSIRTDSLGVRAAIGVVPQEVAVYEDLSAAENLDFWGRMYGLHGPRLRARVDAVLEIIGLAERRKGRVAKFSGGMKRRLNIGIALLHEPQVLFMDEPTVGIDPQSRRNILDSVLALNRAGMTVLYTTHYMEEAQELSNHIAIMDHGKLIAMGTHEELVRSVGEMDQITLRLSEEAPALLAQWRQLEGAHSVSAEQGAVVLLAEDSHLIVPALFESAGRAGVRITSVDVQEPNLESVFLQLTGRGLRD